MRIFLDTCTFQLIYDYGESVFEGVRDDLDNSIEKYPNGERNLIALYNIFEINSAGGPSFSFVLSKTSLEEINNRKDRGFSQYAYDVIDTWNITVTELGEDAFSGIGLIWSDLIKKNEFDYLSDEDRRLLYDALRMECDIFLTVEEKLPKHADHLNNRLPIKVLRPFEFWKNLC